MKHITTSSTFTRSLLTALTFLLIFPSTLLASSQPDYLAKLPSPPNAITNATPNEILISEFISSIRSDNWTEWVMFFTPSVRDMYITFASNESNRKANLGILNVNSSSLVSIDRVPNSCAPRFRELAAFQDNEEDYEVYLVGIQMTVNEISEYYVDGINYKLIILVRDNRNDGAWGVGILTSAPIDLLEQYSGSSIDKAIQRYEERVYGVSKKNGTLSSTTRGVGYGLLTPGSSPPSSIKIYTKATKTSTVWYVVTSSFSNFITNVTHNEIGNMGFNIEAIKVQAIAAKMCGWWAVIAQYRDAVGADIMYEDVSYLDNSPVLGTGVASAASAISSYKILSSNTLSNTADRSKLFYTAFIAGVPNDPDLTGYHTGTMRQYGAHDQAVSGKTWQQIIHYYYDNSTQNNPNVGIVQILN